MAVCRECADLMYISVGQCASLYRSGNSIETCCAGSGLGDSWAPALAIHVMEELPSSRPLIDFVHRLM